MTRRVVIAGGGLAGLTCAKYLVDAGHQVQLFEGLPFLGGRASTYRDADGDWIEQGLHLFFGVYTEFKALLRGIGQDPDDVLFWMSELRLQDPAGPQAVYGINPIQAPLQTVLGFLGQNDYLGPLDKLSLLPIVAPALLDMETLRQTYDGITVEEWWRRSGGTPEVLERFLRPFCRAIQFSDASQFSAYNFLSWLHHVVRGLPSALLGGYRGARDETIFQPLARYIQDRGGEIRTSRKLAAIHVDGGAVSGFELEGGETVSGDAYVAAVPAWALPPVLPAALKAHPFFATIAELPVSPAISVQLWFDRPVVSTAAFTLVGRSLTPVYQDQATNAYPYPRGSRLSVIVAPADPLMDWEDDVLAGMVLDTLGRVEPEVRTANVVKRAILRHSQHLIRPLPWAMSSRPPQRTPVPNLFLAGDWTQQDFFGSQEGAVRGGKACYQEVARWLRRG